MTVRRVAAGAVLAAVLGCTACHAGYSGHCPLPSPALMPHPGQSPRDAQVTPSGC